MEVDLYTSRRVHDRWGALAEGKRFRRRATVETVKAVGMKEVTSPLPHADKPSVSRPPEFVDVFVSGDGKRNGLGQFLDQKIGRQRGPLI